MYGFTSNLVKLFEVLKVNWSRSTFSSANPFETSTSLREDRLRWLSSFAIVLVTYVLPIVWLLYPNNQQEVILPPSAAMVVELSQIAVTKEQDRQLPPDIVKNESAPQKEQTPLPEPELAKELPDIPEEIEEAEVLVKQSPEEPLEHKQEEQDNVEKQEPPPTPNKQKDDSEKEQNNKMLADAATSPPDSNIKENRTAAPKMGIASEQAQRSVLQSWQNTLMLKLNEAKRYPSRARRYRQEGVAYLRFTLDRDGNVLAKNIAQGSGYELLDEETLALIERAKPLPKPPENLSSEQLEFVVPIAFFLTK